VNNALKTIALTTGLLTMHINPAQADSGNYVLPLGLATEAAAEAIKVCEGNGYHVSVAVVDNSGVVKLFAKGDKSTIHTKDSSFRKAYTTVTMGPIFKFDTTGQFVEKLSKNPAAPALASIPDIILLPGGVAIRAQGEIVAAIGVAGAPGGEKDEVCAQAGLAKIISRLPK
jgi:uncharacterized protein GlcG (DUF336 family)